jgi:fermentation-respiration switch protein FrsA (DUF1100 family)
MEGTKSRGTGNAVRIIRIILVGLVILFALVYFGIGAYAANTLTLPKRQMRADSNPGAHSLAYQDLTLHSRDDLVDIAAWYIPYEGASKAVVMVHGKSSSRSFEFGGAFIDRAVALHEGGLAVMMIDLRGHGESGEGRFSFGINERRDVLGAVDWLEAQGFEPGSIGVLGVSMGGGASIGAVAEEESIGALIVDSTYADILPLIEAEWTDESGLPNLFITPTRWMNQLMYGYDLGKAKPVDEIGAIAPRAVMIIHCQTDPLIPFEHAEILSEAAPSAETWFLPDCDHARSFKPDPVAYDARIVAFFKENLK